MKQFSYPTFCSATRALLSKFPTSSSYLNSSRVFHTKYTLISLQKILIPPLRTLCNTSTFLKKHSVFPSSSHVPQAELLPQNLLRRLIQQILFCHQTFSYLPLHFFCLFCTQTEVVKKKTVSFLAALSAEADKTFNAVILITKPSSKH